MHRVIWPYNDQRIGLNIGRGSVDSFEPVVLKAADASIFTVEYQGVRLHFGMQWVVTTAEGEFRLDDGTMVKLLIEVQRPGTETLAKTIFNSKVNHSPH